MPNSPGNISPEINFPEIFFKKKILLWGNLNIVVEYLLKNRALKINLLFSVPEKKSEI